MRRRGAGCAGRSREPVTGGECGGQFVGSAARFGAVFFLDAEYVAGILFVGTVGAEQVGDELPEIAHREAEFTGSGFRLFGAFRQVSVGKSCHIFLHKKAFRQGRPVETDGKPLRASRECRFSPVYAMRMSMASRA